MRKIAIFIVCLLSALFAQYVVCSECGGAIPRECSELPISSYSCSIASASFSCQKEQLLEGWFFCPACPSTYQLAKCEPGWLFGLLKTSYCVQGYPVSCGQYCEEGDNVLSRTACTLQESKKCCTIPTNSIEVVSPAENSPFSKGNVDFAARYSGTVKNISIDYGDGSAEWKLPNVNNISFFSHNYVEEGDFSIVATAYSCNNCSHKYSSSFSINISVR